MKTFTCFVVKGVFIEMFYMFCFKGVFNKIKTFKFFVVKGILIEMFYMFCFKGVFN